MTSTTNHYYGLRIGPGQPGYDGLIKYEFTTRDDGAKGLSLYYMSSAGWVEDETLITAKNDWGTEAVDEPTAATIARDRFHQPL